MGQAKKRGSQAERTQEAKSRADALKPETIVCNSCQKDITEVFAMDTRGMDGITGAYAGMCECGSSTFALSGDPDAVADAAIVLNATMGEEPLVGSQLIRNS